MYDKTDNTGWGGGMFITFKGIFVFALPDLIKMAFNIGHGF